MLLPISVYSQKYSEAIEDNSFFIEEAYNQEEHVVQHISTGLYERDSKNLGYSFTQEWPAFGQAHQLSYTIPYYWLSQGNGTGIGDVMLNYRYQFWQHDDAVTFSPRFSLILPTGDQDKGTGNGVWAFQVNMPFSKRISEAFAAHVNLGVTVYPGVKATDIYGIEQKNTVSTVFTGGSLIWLATKNINFMLEYLANFNRDYNDVNAIEKTTQHIICPGVRYAIDINDLQIVPGVAFPVTLEGNKSQTNFFFYLSFEHPY